MKGRMSLKKLPKTLQSKFITLYDVFIGALKYVLTLQYRSKNIALYKGCFFSAAANNKSLFFVLNWICCPVGQTALVEASGHRADTYLGSPTDAYVVQCVIVK